MKFQKRTLRLALIAAVAVAVSYPLLSEFRNNRASAQTPLPGQAKPEPAIAFPLVDPEKVVVSIGDEKITAGEFTALFSQIEPRYQAYIIAHPEAKRQLAEHYIDAKLLAGEARQEKLDQTIAVKTTYDQILASAMEAKFDKEKEANAKFYVDNKDYFATLQTRHILVAVAGSGIDSKLTDAQAKAKAESIKARLDKGEDFAALARSDSDDPGSAATGGNLGMVSRDGRMVPAFEQAAFALKDNEISGLVKTQYGYHIIQVLSRTIPQYDQVADRVPPRRLELLVEELKKTRKPEIDDAFFSSAKLGTTQPSTAPATDGK